MAALPNTAAAAEDARAGSILSSRFARQGGQGGGVTQNIISGLTPGGRSAATAYEVPPAARMLATLDLAGLADGVAAQLKLQVITGMDAWKAARAVVPKPLQATLGRLIEVQLNATTIWSMRKMREADNALKALNLEKARGPVMPKAPFFTLGIAYDYYASLVLQYGSKPARDALKQRGMVLLALRNQSSALANRGLGSYDDHIVVLNGVGRLGVARVFAACTEPGAQYSHRAATGQSSGRIDARYANVKYAHTEGFDVNGDHIKDAGRLVAGTYQYFEREKHYLGDRAFRAKQTQVAERDTDGDGRFTSDDPDRIDRQLAQTSMLIHQGGPNDNSGSGTWSAGCQTIPTTVYTNFLKAVGMPTKGFYYVLVNAAMA